MVNINPPPRPPLPPPIQPVAQPIQPPPHDTDVNKIDNQSSETMQFKSLQGEVRGRYFMTGSKFEAVTIKFNHHSERLEIIDLSGILLANFNPKLIKIDPHVPGLALQVWLFSDDMEKYLFECDDLIEFAKLLKRLKVDPFNTPFVGKKFKPIGWGLLVLLAVLLPVFYWFIIPYAADRIATVLPDSFFTNGSQNLLSELDKKIFQPSRLSDSRKTQINLIFNDLQKVSDLERPTRLLFRNSGFMGANAMALPDGTLVVLDDLVDLVNSDDEIAGVLAHEMGHITHRHSARQYARATAISLIFYFVFGDGTGWWDEVASTGVVLTQLSYSREFELEADKYSAGLMLQLGYDPDAMIFLLDKMGAKDKTRFFDSHPGLQERGQAVKSQ